MTDTEPSQPLTDAELALMERLWAPHQTYVRDLLDEVYRLRAKITGLQTTLINAHEAGMSLGQEVEQLRTQVQDYHQSADEHTAKFDRQHERLVEAQGEAKRLQAERAQLLHDVLWYASEFGVEHWRECDLSEEDCYLCEGHQATRGRALAMADDQSAEGQANG